MDLENTLKRINKDRQKVEACFVMSLWKDPSLYDEYTTVNSGKDETLKDKDAVFYFNLGRAMRNQGFNKFDAITVDSYLSDKPTVQKKFEEYGGMYEVEQLKSLVSVENIESYFDEIAKKNTLTTMCSKYNELFTDISRFDNATNEDIYNTFELLNSSVSIASGHTEQIQDITIDDDFITGLESGENIGFNYGRFSPLLNYITLGCEPGSLYLIGGHSGVGKSSFAFGNMIMGLHYSGVGCAIISNEMNISTYKILLLIHILTQDMNYWGLTRKQLRMGKFTAEEREKIREAQKISKEKYSDIKFVKMFDNDINKIMKYMRRLKTTGTSVVFYDTFKSDDSADSSQLWQSLMLDARKLFQCCSKLDICCITTYQLALHTTNQRYLDASCLSNSKQIKEVYSTMIYSRILWEDEYTGEKFDVHPYKFNKDNNKIKEDITLDPNEKYMLVFIDKTRADEDKQILIYQWRARFNQWRELGFAKVVNEHRAY